MRPSQSSPRVSRRDFLKISTAAPTPPGGRRAHLGRPIGWHLIAQQVGEGPYPWAAPHRALLEIGQRQAETLSEIRNNLPAIVAPVWEALARQHLLVASGRGQIPFPLQQVGSWWARGAQVDVIGVNRADHRVVFGEARWRSTPVTTADLHALMEKGLLWLKGDTARWDVHYAFFARNVGQVEEAGLGEESVHVFTPDGVASVNT